jgi:hypothetical protein
MDAVTFSMTSSFALSPYSGVSQANIIGRDHCDSRRVVGREVGIACFATRLPN